MDDKKYIHTTPDVIYTAKAVGIAANDLHEIMVGFSRYMEDHATTNGQEIVTAYMKWIAESTLCLWEVMIPAGIGPVEISESYENGYLLSQLIEELGEIEYAAKARARWDDILVMTQESRDEWGEGMIIDPRLDT